MTDNAVQILPREQNIRFRELTPGVEVELIATRIEFNYVPGGAGELTAQWWAQEYLPVGDTFQRLGDQGDRLTTRLSDYATTVLDAGTDPVTGQPIALSAAGAVQWLRYWFDYQINLERGPVQVGDTDTATLP